MRRTHPGIDTVGECRIRTSEHTKTYSGDALSASVFLVVMLAEQSDDHLNSDEDNSVICTRALGEARRMRTKSQEMLVGQVPNDGTQGTL